MDKEDLVQFWVEEACDNCNSMLNMFSMREYTWSLFVGHLTIEKLLKAYYVKTIDKNIPFVHSLLKLANKSNLQLTEIQKDKLEKITLFNIKTRYESYKRDFYKKCTKDFTKQNIENILEIKEWLLKEIYKKL